MTQSFIFTDAKYLEGLLKIAIDPKNMAESTLSFNLNAKGDIYQYTSTKDWYWSPGHYNMSASLMVINVVKPTPR